MPATCAYCRTPLQLVDGTYQTVCGCGKESIPGMKSILRDMAEIEKLLPPQGSINSMTDEEFMRQIGGSALTSTAPKPERDVLADMKAMIPAMIEEAESHNQRVRGLRDALLGRMADMSPSELSEFMRANRGNLVLTELFSTKPLGPPKVEFSWP